ncbi:MAG TPA: DEAD/DEAH box helicase [Aeromonadales bacterium]|nr:DEAD/DEAH box helicase [Aeromonadales bacterium]
MHDIIHRLQSLGILHYVDKPSQLSKWMLGQRSEKPLTTKDPLSRTRYKLLYLLEFDANDWFISIHQARIDWSGKVGKPKALDWTRVQQGNYPSAADQQDISLLQPLSSTKGYLRELSDETRSNILSQLVNGKKLHFQTFYGQPLEPGSSLSASLEWEINAQGQQRAQWLNSASTDSLYIDPDGTHYVDIRAGTLGTLELLNTTTHTENFMALTQKIGCWLDAENTNDLITICRDLGLPAPKEISIIKGEQPELSPSIRLDSIPAEQDKDRWVHRATIFMNYAHAQVDTASDRVDARIFENHQITSYPRDLDAEKQAVHLLENISWRTRTLLHGQRKTLATDNDWLDFMLNDIPQLEKNGWRVLISPHFHFRLAEADNIFGQIEEVQKTDWFGFRVDATIDGKQVQLLPLIVNQIDTLNAALAHRDEGAIMLKLTDGRQLPLERELVAQILGTLVELFEKKPADGEQIEIRKSQAGQLLELEKNIKLDWRTGLDWRTLVLQLVGQKPIKDIKQTQTFTAKLRDYQQQGLNWLQILWDNNLGGILADDMGLGKTVQTLAHLDRLKADKKLKRPALVLAPTSLLYNWQNEAKEFSPDLSTIVIHGTERDRLWGEAARHDVIITSYPLLRRDWHHIIDREFSLLVLDEAQMLKNPAAKTTQLTKQLKTKNRIALTGTPMENHLGELWSLFDILLPGYLGSQRGFQRLYRKPIEQHSDVDRQKALSQRVSPFLLRRKKTEVELELPPKTEIVNTVTLHQDQQNLYETIRLAMHQKVQDAIRSKGLERSQLVILDALLKLRQLCCHPRLVKLQAAQTIRHSAKLEMLMTMLEEMQEEGRRVLLFSQFTQMLAIISQSLKDKNIEHVTLTGSTRHRQPLIDQFQTGEVPVFLISLKAGGTGLNLTAADTVIHYDPWWNPAVENQATDRAHRIGQDKPVFVYRLICKDSVEEKIQQLQNRKKQLYEAILDNKAQSRLSFTMDDIEELFAPLA